MSNANPRYIKAWPNEQLNAGGGAGTVTSVGTGSGLLGGPITTAGTLSVDYGTSADLLSGADTVKLYHAAALSGASVAGISAGAGDAGKFVRLDPTGKLDGSVVAAATAADVIAGTAGKIVDAAALSLASVKTFGTLADDGKYVRVTTSGKIDPTLLPISSALVYRGVEQPASAAPATAAVGDVYLLDAAGTFGASWGVLSGTTGAIGDQLIYDGTKWNLIKATSPGGTVTSVASGSGLLGGPITSAGTLSLDYGTAADLITGTDTTKVYHAAALSGAAKNSSAGAADAGKLVKLDATGKIDGSMLPPAGGSGTVTNIATGTGLTGGPITTTGTIALATSGVAAGTYNSVTVDTYGRVTAATNPTTLAGYGITDAVPTTASVSGGGSLTGGGALSGAPLTIQLVGDAAAPGNAKYYGTDGAGTKGWYAFPAAGGTGTVTNIATGTGLTGGPINTTGTIALAASGVTAGTSGSATAIPVVTVDTYGRITSISTQTVTPAWTDVTGKPTTVAASGLTDAVASTRTITGATSLTGGGDLTANRTISLVGDAAAPGNNMYYGTDGSGTKGFFAIPAGGGGGGSGTVTSVTAGTGLTGGTISTSGTIALATSGVTAGTYNSVTVDTYGRVTAGTNPTTLAGYGITDGVVSTRTVTGATSLTGGGDLTANRTISLVGDAAAPGNSFYYGTNAAGTKGFYALPASATITYGTTAELLAGTDTTKVYAADQIAGAGYVRGPATATDNAVARYDATTGKLIQNSGVIIDDSNNVSGVVNLTTSGNTTLGDAAADAMTFNGSTLAVPNNLNIDSNTLMIDAANNRVGFGTATPLARVDVNGSIVSNVVPTTGDMDLALGQMFTSTSTANTSWSFSNTPASRGAVVWLHLTNGGNFTQTWPASVVWEGGSAPTFQTAGTDVIKFVTHDGGTTWYGHSLTAGGGSSAANDVIDVTDFRTNGITFDNTIGKVLIVEVFIDKGAVTAGVGATSLPNFWDGTAWSSTVSTWSSMWSSTFTSTNRYNQARYYIYRSSATTVHLVGSCWGVGVNSLTSETATHYTTATRTAAQCQKVRLGGATTISIKVY